MYTSDKNKTPLISQSLSYAVLTAVTALFGAVYEIFSHQVYSYFMIYAFSIPLVLGTIPALCALRFGITARIGIGWELWGFGVITLTTGCLFYGVLEIYGTTNVLAIVYPAAGIILLLSGLFLSLRRRLNTANT